MPSRGTGLHSKSPATVTYGTLVTMDADVLPLQMLRHQLTGLSKSGRARFEEVRVYLNHGNALLKDIENDLKDVSAKVQLLDESLFSNYSVLKRFFKFPTVGTSLKQVFPDDMFFDQVLAITSFLNDCSSIYCVWMDPDIFVHRASNGQGWVDFAIATMDNDSAVSLMTQPLPNLVRGADSTEADCENRGAVGVSQRHMVIHKERFLKEFPIRLTCAPDCDSWEAVISNQSLDSTIFNTHCGGHGFWVTHKADSEDNIEELLRLCAPDKHSIEQGLDSLLEYVETVDLGELHAEDSANGDEHVVDEGGWTCAKNISRFFRLALTEKTE